MRYARDPNEFTRRNIEAGRRTAAIGDRRRSEFAKLLQGEKNIGYANVANIRQAGADRRLAVERTPTKAEEFFQGLMEQYGPAFMRKDLGEEFLPEEEEQSSDPSRAKVWRPEKGDIVPPFSALPDTGIPASDAITIPPSSLEYAPKTDVSTTKPARIGQGMSDAWDRSTRTPIGRMFDLENVTEALKKTWRGLDYIGEGMEKGVGRGFKYLFTPKRRKENRTARP